MSVVLEATEPLPSDTKEQLTQKLCKARERIWELEKYYYRHKTLLDALKAYVDDRIAEDKQ